MILGILNQVFSGLHIPDSPRCDYLYGRIESFDGGFKTNLVVALACTAMADIEGAFFFSDIYEGFGHERSCHGCSEQVGVFIDCAGFENRPDIVFDEFLLYIYYVGFGSAGLIGLFLDFFKIYTMIDYPIRVYLSTKKQRKFC